MGFGTSKLRINEGRIGEPLKAGDWVLRVWDSIQFVLRKPPKYVK